MKIIISISITIAIITLGFLGYQNYQLNKRLNDDETMIKNMTVALNITSAFIDKFSQGQFKQFAEQIIKQ